MKFTHNFKNEFKKYIGAPDRYQHFPDDRQIEYVSLRKLKPLDENFNYRAEENIEGYFFDGHIIEERDEGLVFGLGLWVDRWENSFPKEFLIFRITFRPREGKTTIRIHLVPFEIDMTDNSTWAPAFDHIIIQVRKILTTFGPPEAEDETPKPYRVDYFAEDPSRR